MIELGQRLRIIRTEHRMTQQQLAARLGVSCEEIASYEYEWTLPSYAILLQLSRIFEVSTDTLLGNDKNYDNTLNLTGLTKEEKALLKQLADAFRRRSAPN